MDYPRNLQDFNSEGYKATAFEWIQNGACSVVGDMDVDVDGSLPNIYHDPYYQNDTTLHYNGKPLNTDEDSFAVLPKPVMQEVKGKVLGCQGLAINLKNGKSYPFVIGDVGPTKKIGEGSRKLAIKLGINPDPNNGGEDDRAIMYIWWPGVAASIDGKQYQLQSI